MSEVVRVLPFRWPVMIRRRKSKWQGAEDVRIICDCQRHARRRKSLWPRGLRVATRGAAVLASIPLALAAFDIPMSAMNLKLVTPDIEVSRGTEISDLQKTQAPLQQAQKPANDLPIFTTDEIRKQFLAGTRAAVSLDVFKEDYFRRHVPYGAIIYREARRYDLPPELVAAMVHTESDFRPKLVSNKSAQGLMQIIPSTAALLGIRDPFDPEQNIAAGTKYFRYLLDRFDNEAVALAAYNAGEGNVERFGGIPPFPETREYIARVNRRTHRYRQRVHSTYMATLRVQHDMAP